MAQHRGSEEIQQAMAATRHALVHDVQIAQTRARQLVDWRYQFRMHPAALCAAAAVLGYLIVPGRKRSVGPVNPTEGYPASELADESTPQSSPSTSLAGELGRMIAVALAKHAVHKISEYGLSAFRRAADASHTDSERGPHESQVDGREEGK